MKLDRTLDFSELLGFYRRHLLDEVMPFWMKHAIDIEHGGIYTGIRDDGSLITTDKYIWSNTRAIYTFSALYNYVEKEQKWLDTAKNICDFCLAHGRDERGIWGYRVDQQGNMLEGEMAIQVDAFAMMGLTEYVKATGDKTAADAALETYESVKERLAHPGSYGTFPYPLPEGAKAHRDYFQFALAYLELGRLLGRSDILEESLARAEVVMDSFRRPERQVLVEYVSLDDRMLDTPQGRTMVPGHAIESMWFMIHVYRHFGKQDRIRQAVETIRWGLEKGWDSEYGGIFLGIDIDGKDPPYWKNAEKKIWWVFSESLYSLLLAYEQSREDWCLDWYRKVHEWTFSHFPDTENGEWSQKLDRRGEKTDEIIALPVKDPFHLPRALIMCIDVLKRLSGGAAPA